MKCPNCQRDNPFGARACEICGRPFTGDHMAVEDLSTKAAEAGRTAWSGMSTAAADWTADASTDAAQGPGQEIPPPPGTPDGRVTPRAMPSFGGGTTRVGRSSMKVLVWVLVAIGYVVVKVIAAAASQAG